MDLDVVEPLDMLLQQWAVEQDDVLCDPLAFEDLLRPALSLGLLEQLPSVPLHFQAPRACSPCVPAAQTSSGPSSLSAARQSASADSSASPTGSLQLPAVMLRQATSRGPPSRMGAGAGAPRLVTTVADPQPNDEVQPARIPSAEPCAAPAPPSSSLPASMAYFPTYVPVATQLVIPPPAEILDAGHSAHSHDSGSDDSEDTEDMHEGATKANANKRKAPDVDWRSIEDVQERRRQRRLAKNRVTAARSRERKKLQWADMEAKLNALQSENMQLRNVLEQMAQENSSLREHLNQLAAGGKGLSGNLGGRSTQPAVLVFIVILLLGSLTLPSDQAAVLLGSCVPLVLLAQQLAANGSKGASLQEQLLHFIADLKLLVSRCSKRFSKSIERLLFHRHHFIPASAFSTMSRSCEHSMSSLAHCIRARNGGARHMGLLG